MPVCSVVSFSATVEILIRLYRRGGGERRLDTAQTIGPNCGVTHSPGTIEYNCRYFLMTFRKRIRKNKFSKNGFHNLQGTMSHRPLTNASSLKITAAYCADTVSQVDIFFPAFGAVTPLPFFLVKLSPTPFPV